MCNSQAKCNQQQALGARKNTCTINGQTIMVGSRMAPIACTPEKLSPAQRAIVAPVPGVGHLLLSSPYLRPTPRLATQTVRAYSNARETIQQAVLNETKAYIQRNPSVCKGLTTSACQNFVKRTIVTQPDYTPVLKPLPKLTDVLAKQLVKLGVYQSEEWAQQAAKRCVCVCADVAVHVCFNACASIGNPMLCFTHHH